MRIAVRRYGRQGGGAPVGCPGRFDRGTLVSLCLLFLAGGTFGLIFSLNRIAITGGVPFLSYVFWQAFLGALGLLVIGAAARKLPQLTWPHLRAYFIVGGFTLAFPYILLALLAPKLPAGVVSLGGTLSPTLTYLFALTLRRDSFRWVRVAGIGAGLAGVLLVVIPDTGLPDPEMTGWVLLSLLVPVCYAAGTIAAALFPPPGGASLAMATGHLFLSSAIIFPVMAGTDQWWFFSGPMTETDWAVIGAAAINALFYFLLFEIVRRAGPVFFATQNYIATLSGIGWAIWIHGESHSAWIWGALALLLLGLFLVTRRTAHPNTG